MNIKIIIKFVFIILFSIFGSLTTVFAQAPQAISYQAIVRDLQGNIIKNQAISLRMSITQNGTTDNAVYIETHLVTTNAFGLVNLQIGKGTIVTGNFAEIDWSMGNYFSKTEIDITGGSNYAEIGTSQILSVPYSLHANKTFGISGYSREQITQLTPIEGQIVYNITDDVLIVYSNGRWHGSNMDINCWPQLTQPDAGADQILTNNITTTTLAANIPEYGIGKWTIIKGDGGSFADDTSPKTIFTGKINTQYTLAWSISNNCEHKTDFVNIYFLSLQGVFISGAATLWNNVVADAMLNQGYIEGEQFLPIIREGLWEGFVYLTDASEGFFITIAKNDTIQTMGVGTRGVKVGGNGNSDLIYDSIVVQENAMPITVAKTGLYHIVYDEQLKVALLLPVQTMGIIGSATPDSWSISTPLTQKTLTPTMGTWEITGLVLKTGEYLFRYNNNWTARCSGSFIGFSIFTNWGGTLSNLVMGKNVLKNDIAGIYTVTVQWSSATGFSATLTKTGEIPSTDYANVELGFIGDGILDANNNPGDWVNTYMLQKPVATNTTIYTWTWNNIGVAMDKHFKIRQNNTWNEIVIGYSNVTMQGSAAAKFIDAFGDFVPTENGRFDFTLTIDTTTQKFVLQIEPHTP